MELMIEEQWKAHLQSLCNTWVDQQDTKEIISADERDRKILNRKKELLKERHAQIVKTKLFGKPIRSVENQKGSYSLDYFLHIQMLIKQKDDFFVEEHAEYRRTGYDGEGNLYDRAIQGIPAKSLKNEEPVLRISPTRQSSYRRYNRLDAVKYADRFWQNPNKHFKTFEVDCTNFISQCLLSGGIPMTGQKVRGKGWWYSGASWSYSWAVANAFRWYLSEDKNIMGAVQMDSPDQLMPGDVICYDFEGDGRWDHSTIVTEKDAYGMPLVNARTVSARHRYWSYEDSYAYTDKTAYRFFHIGERVPLS